MTNNNNQTNWAEIAIASNLRDSKKLQEITLINELYGKEAAQEAYKKYLEEKNRLKDRLINTLWYIGWFLCIVLIGGFFLLQYLGIIDWFN